jgi:CRP-like cAMP-binding protein
MAVQIDHLRMASLFQGLSPESLRQIADFSTLREAKRGETLVKEGYIAEDLFIVSAGEVALKKQMQAHHGQPPRDTTVGICRRSEIVGWSSVVPPHFYTLSATAREASEVVVVDGVKLREFLASNPDAGFNVLMGLSEVISRRLRLIEQTLMEERALVIEESSRRR